MRSGGAFLLLFFILLFNIDLKGQEQDCKITISGKIISGDTGEPIAFGNIYQERTQKGATSDEHGNFTIDGLCPGHLHLIVSHVNYETQKFQLDLEKDTELEFELVTNIKLLSTITVVGKKDVKDVGYARVSLSRSALDEQSGKSLGESLEAVSGVTTLKTGPGITKPMIHGLYGNRIRIINNDIRQEGQQWGNEHAPEIDPFAADRITVVKGASVVKYGTDAISGAILVEPAPFPEDHHIHGEVNLVGMSNGRMGVLAGQLEGGIGSSESFRWRVQGTLKKAGDFNTPDYFLTNTGVQERNLSVRAGTIGKKVNSEFYYSYFNTTLGILRGSHIGNLTDLEDAITREVPYFTNENFSYDINNPKQEVKHHIAKARVSAMLDNHNTLEAIYGFQFNNRKEFDVRRGGRSEKPALDMDLPSHSLDTRWIHNSNEFFNSELGIRYTYQTNSNNPETGVRPLIPDYVTYKPGVYWIGKYSREKWDLETGIGYDYQYLQVKKFDRNNELIKPEHRYNNISATVGGSFNINRFMRYNVNFGYAMRAPNVNELYSEGLHHGAAAIEEGDPNLNPERSFKNIHSFTFLNSDKYSFEISGYFHHVKDFIYLRPEPEARLTIRGAFPVYSYVQTDANIWGIDVGGRLKLMGPLYWETKASTVHGYNLKENEYLIYMPADRWNNKLIFQSKTNGSIQEYQFAVGGLQVWQQTRTPMNEVDPEEMFDSQVDYNYAVYEDYLPPPEGYFLLEFEAGMTLKVGQQRLKIHGAVRNMLNTSYRDYLNRLRYFADDIGRNVELRVKYMF